MLSPDTQCKYNSIAYCFKHEYINISCWCYGGTQELSSEPDFIFRYCVNAQEEDPAQRTQNQMLKRTQLEQKKRQMGWEEKEL